MVGICLFAPFSYSEAELFALASEEGVFDTFGGAQRDRIDGMSSLSSRMLSLGGLLALGRLCTALSDFEYDLSILRDKFGKPRFEDGRAPAFSIAHAHRLSVAAISDSADALLGVDIERIDTKRDIDRIAEKFFSEGEKQRLYSSPDKLREFYSVWTAKEAMMKQGGEGMISVMSSDSVKAEEQGERCFWRSAFLFEGEEYILTLSTEKSERVELLTLGDIKIK